MLSLFRYVRDTRLTSIFLLFDPLVVRTVHCKRFANLAVSAVFADGVDTDE